MAAIANSTFLDYRMPTTLDLPMIDTVIVEVPNPGHPFGIEGKSRGDPHSPRHRSSGQRGLQRHWRSHDQGTHDSRRHH